MRLPGGAQSQSSSTCIPAFSDSSAVVQPGQTISNVTPVGPLLRRVHQPCARTPSGDGSGPGAGVEHREQDPDVGVGSMASYLLRRLVLDLEAVRSAGEQPILDELDRVDQEIHSCRGTALGRTPHGKDRVSVLQQSRLLPLVR